MSRFEHVISLGSFCSTALELERVGLREASMPFDWLISDWQGVEDLIDHHFKDFLRYDLLYQEKYVPKHYKNIQYGVAFFHDFDPYRSLKEQLDSVSEKYRRRIERFYDYIIEPTLFIRYIKDTDECRYFEKNIDSITRKAKGYNSQNRLIFVANDDMSSSLLPVYPVHTDENDTVARKFLEKSPSLFTLLADPDLYSVEKKGKNMEVYLKKHREKGISHRIADKLEGKFKNVYIHENRLDEHF